MLLEMLPELREQLLWYLSTGDVITLSSTNSQYRSLLREKIFRKVYMSSTFAQQLKPFLSTIKDTEQSAHAVLRCAKIVHFPLRFKLTGLQSISPYKAISSFPSIEELHFPYHQFLGSTQKAIKSLCKGLQDCLKVLDLSHTDVTDADCLQISKLSSLEQLVIFHCSHITDEGMVHIGGVNTLVKLDLGCMMLTKTTFEHISNLTLLTHLVLFNWFSDSNSQTVNHLNKLTQLHTLDLTSCHHINNDCWSVFSKLPLQNLKLFRCYGFDSIGVSHIASVKTLRKLDLCQCEGLNDGDISLLVHLPLLEELRVEGCRFLTNACVPYFLQMKSLKKLNIKHCGFNIVESTSFTLVK